MRALSLWILLAVAPLAWAQKPDASAETLRMEMVFWESVRGSTDPADFRAYLEQYPNGKFAPLARNRLAALTPPAPAAATIPASGAAAPAPASMNANPRYPVAGDSWIYRLTDVERGRPVRQRKYLVTIANAQGGIVDQVSIEGGVPLQSTHGTGSYLISQAVSVLSPYFTVFEDLQPGRRLSNVQTGNDPSCNRRGEVCEVEGSVVRREVIETQAGRFDSVKVTFKQTWRPASPGRELPPSREVSAWYAPQVKRVVRISSRTATGYAIQPDFDLELTSYKLQ
jgi:hypothetical protein